jgi:hypothetical protein
MYTNNRVNKNKIFTADAMVSPARIIEVVVIETDLPADIVDERIKSNRNLLIVHGRLKKK